MIVKAKYNHRENIPFDIRHYAFEDDEKDTLPLTIGKDYVVAGIRQTSGHDFYLIVSDAGQLNKSPWWYPGEIFKVMSDGAPNDWIWGGDEKDRVYTFPELAKGYSNGSSFQSELEDGEELAISIFTKYMIATRQMQVWLLT